MATRSVGAQAVLLAELGEASPADAVTGLALAKARVVAGQVAGEVDGDGALRWRCHRL